MHSYSVFNRDDVDFLTGDSNALTLSQETNGELVHVVRDASGAIISKTLITLIEVLYHGTDAPFTLTILDDLLASGQAPQVQNHVRTGDPCADFREQTVNNHLIVEFFPPSQIGQTSVWTFNEATPPLKLKIKLKRQGIQA